MTCSLKSSIANIVSSKPIHPSLALGGRRCSDIPHAKVHLVASVERHQLGPLSLRLHLIRVRFGLDPRLLTSLLLQLLSLVGGHIDMRFSTLRGQMGVVDGRDYDLLAMSRKAECGTLQRDTGVVAR